MPAARMSYAALAAACVLALCRPAAADLSPEAPDRFDTTESASVEGTVWEGQDCPERFAVTYRFEKDGLLVYSYNGSTYRNGKWTQDGSAVYFEINDKYRECLATVCGDRIEGRSWNVAGKKWETILRRSKSP